MTQSCSTFAIKCSWQIVYVLINFAKVVVVDPCMLWDWFLPCFASWSCLLAGSMLSLSCNALCWVHRARKHAYVTLFLPCLVSAKSESVNETCYVYMGAIISSDPSWLMVSKGLLLYALSRFMPCLAFLCSVLVACCNLALNIASWC